MWRKLIAVTATATLLTACGGSSGGGPPPIAPPNLSGTWHGNYRSSTTGDVGALSLALVQNGQMISGVFQLISYTGAALCMNSGDVSGVVSGNALSASLMSGTGRIDVAATITAGQLIGSYTTNGTCAGDYGTFTAS